ncbi:hypothetical protein [Kitasatospora fiedleri]|uniref:hypothetical protein n=1 Tax=Kitasatospora fiedleri TaxID=2991545 RepID=UPI00249B0C9B|nr:hypothetical protein [Kitasatospora fiedleri]
MSIEEHASDVAERIERELDEHYDEDDFIRRLAERIQAGRRRPSSPRAGGVRPGRPEVAAGAAPVAASPATRATAGRPTPQLMPAACRADLRVQLGQLCDGIIGSVHPARPQAADRVDDVRAVLTGCILYSRGSEALAEWWWQRAADAGSSLAPHLLSVLFAATCREDEAGHWRIHAEAVGLTVPSSAGWEDLSTEVLLSDEVSEAAVHAVVEQWPACSPVSGPDWIEHCSSVDPSQPPPRPVNGRSVRRRTLPASASPLRPSDHSGTGWPWI